MLHGKQFFIRIDVLKADPTMTRESKLQRFLRTLKKEGQITSEVYSEIYPTGSIL